MFVLDAVCPSHGWRSRWRSPQRHKCGEQALHAGCFKIFCQRQMTTVMITIMMAITNSRTRFQLLIQCCSTEGLIAADVDKQRAIAVTAGCLLNCAEKAHQQLTRSPQAYAGSSALIQEIQIHTSKCFPDANVLQALCHCSLLPATCV